MKNVGDNTTNELVRISKLSKEFPLPPSFPSFKRSSVKALIDVSFSINRGQTVGLVGESGSGKTTIGRAIIRLLRPDRGQILFHDKDIVSIKTKDLVHIKPKIQMVFQDPYNTLNPLLTVKKIVEEPLQLNKSIVKGDISEIALEMLNRVGISKKQTNRLPHEFSGGQRQRIAIARAFVLSPELIICDEAVSALDVSIQARIINLLLDFQERFSPAYLFISHDLSVVRIMSDIIVVLYLGRIMEIGETDDLIENPLHPYTKALLSAVPDLKNRKITSVPKGEICGNIDLPPGCPYQKFCKYCKPICIQAMPSLETVVSGRKAACFLLHDKVEE